MHLSRPGERNTRKVCSHVPAGIPLPLWTCCTCTSKPPLPPREYHAISCANIQNFFLLSQHFRPHFCTCTASTCYICVLQVIHWGLSTSVLRDSQTSSRFSLPPSCLCLLWQTGWVTLPSPPAQQCTRFVSFALGGVLAVLLYDILDSICCHWK